MFSIIYSPVPTSKSGFHTILADPPWRFASRTGKVRPEPHRLAAGRRQVNPIESRKREHSRKPDEQYRLIESCSPAPYFELFGRYSQTD